MTIILHHPDIEAHDAGNIVEAIATDRVEKIGHAVLAVEGTRHVLARAVDDDDVLRVHTPEYWEYLQANAPEDDQEVVALDEDTYLNNNTLRAVKLSAGAAVQGAGLLREGKAKNAFGLVLAGHHACPGHAEGFCFLSNAAIAARHALDAGAKRVAVADYDTHSGNGTIAALAGVQGALVVETYQDGYPGSIPTEHESGNIHRSLVRAQSGWRDAWQTHLQTLQGFKPELLILSAGYDAHSTDPLGKIGLADDDFAWLDAQLLALGVPVLALLEGGYNVQTTARLAANLVKAMSI